MNDVNKGLFFKVLPKVIDSISYMFSDVEYNTISFVPVTGESSKGKDLRLKGYNIFAKRLFGQFSLVAENENTTIIPIPDAFKNRVHIKENMYQVDRDNAPDNSFQQFQQSLNKPNTNPILQGNQEAVITPNDNQELLYKLNDIFEDRTSLIFNINNNKDFDTNSRLKAIRSLIDNKEVNYNNHLEHLEEYLELFEHLPAIHNLINKYGSKQAILEVYDNENASGNNNLQQEFIEAVNGLKSIFRNVNKTKLNLLENWLDKNIVDINKIDIQDKDDNVLYPTEQYSLDVNNEKFIKYYYELSGKKEDIITFAKRLKSTIATYKLLGYNNDKILEMLKCL